jgi:hypothetical protein
MKNFAVEFTLTRDTLISLRARDLADEPDRLLRLKEHARPTRVRIMQDRSGGLRGMTLFVRVEDGFGETYWDRDACVPSLMGYYGRMEIGQILPLVFERLLSGAPSVKNITAGGEIYDLGDL